MFTPSGYERVETHEDESIKQRLIDEPEESYWSQLQQYCYLSDTCKKNMYKIGCSVGLLVGLGIYFAIASTVPTKIYLCNQTSEIISADPSILYLTPLGTKGKHESVILPYACASFEFNGINSYFDYESSAGTFHVGDSGHHAKMKGSAGNKKVEKAIPFIFFNAATYNYVQTNPSPVNDTSNAVVEEKNSALSLRGSRV